MKNIIGNLFSEIPDNLSKELITLLAESKDVRVERIISKGQVSPDGFWYDQNRTEFVLLIQGEAKLEFEGEKSITSMVGGDYLVIPPHVRHRVVWTTPDKETIWLAVHY